MARPVSKKRVRSHDPAYNRRPDPLPRVLDPPQQYFAALAEAPAGRKRKPSVSKPITPPAERVRAELERSYADRVKERFDLRRLVTYVPNKSLPVYNWFKYKEGFSRELVLLLLDKFQVGPDDIVFDPFAGCGTTLLACKESGRSAVGIDILPIAAYVAAIKLEDWDNLDGLVRAANDLLARPKRKPRTDFPAVRIVDLAFDAGTKQELLFFKEEIETFPKATRGFLTLALLSILERVSRTSKDGQFLRLVEKDIPGVRDTLREQLMTMIADLSRMRQSFLKGTPGKAAVSQGDARLPCLPDKYLGKVASIITSPPYLNRYDYSRTYALELCLLFVKDFDDMRRIRHSLLRSHIESKEHEGKEIDLPALSEILAALQDKHLNNERIPVMIKGYFEDMNLVIKNMAAYLRPGGRVALVVANAQFAGEHVPTEMMLSELAARHGLATDEIWISRYKGNSSQQMAQYGRRPVRESIIFWRKHGGR